MNKADRYIRESRNMLGWYSVYRLPVASWEKNPEIAMFASINDARDFIVAFILPAGK